MRQAKLNHGYGMGYSSQGQLAYQPYSPSVTESFLHQQRVQSKFKKHAVRLQTVATGLVVAALVFGVFQTSRTLIAGIYKLSVLSGQQAAVESYHAKSLVENKDLSDRIQTYSAPAGIEELARNNLEMVGKDEVLVRIH
jgi:cell division protein FtsB